MPPLILNKVKKAYAEYTIHSVVQESAETSFAIILPLSDGKNSLRSVLIVLAFRKLNPNTIKDAITDSYTMSHQMVKNQLMRHCIIYDGKTRKN